MTDRNALFKELEHEIQFYSASTKSQYRAHVSDFLDYVGDRDWKEREIVYGYIDALVKKRKLSQSTINYIVRGPIGILFRMYGLRLPVKLPKPGVNMIDLATRISFSNEEIISLIKAARASGNSQWQFVMAVSTVFALRAGEIMGIRKEDTHPTKKTIIIHTLKGGLLREHIVPPEIQRYIFNYDFKVLSKDAMYNIFRGIAAVAGMENIPKKCYHAIRHGVITSLEQLRDKKGNVVLVQADLYRWARWRGGGMLQTYVTPREYDLDKVIFAKHPFLRFWK